MFGRVLFPVDESVASARTREYAFLLVEVYDGEIHALAVFDSSDVPEDVDAMVVEDPIDTDTWQVANRAIAPVIEANEQASAPVIDPIRRRTSVEGILTYAAESEISLVVLGTHTPGRLAWFLRDSIAEQAIQQSPVPVWFVREREDQEPVRIQQILVVTDGSEGAHRTSEYAFDLGSTFDTSVRGLYVMESRFGSVGSLHMLLSREGERILRELQAGGAQAGIDVTPTTRKGWSANEILLATFDRNTDLVVLGA